MNHRAVMNHLSVHRLPASSSSCVLVVHCNSPVGVVVFKMSKIPHLTRKTTDMPVIGQPINVSGFNVLPTKMDVLKYEYFEWVHI